MGRDCAGARVGAEAGIRAGAGGETGTEAYSGDAEIRREDSGLARSWALNGADAEVRAAAGAEVGAGAGAEEECGLGLALAGRG